MLGIRRYQGVAIDLFQGDPTLFVGDAAVSSVAEIERADAAGARHLVFQPPSSPQELLVLKEFLDLSQERGLSHVRRISFLTSSLDEYYQYQSELFRVFPEDE